MNSKLLLFSCLLLISHNLFSEQMKVDSLLKVLDSEVLNSRHYVEKKTIAINSLKSELKYTSLTDQEGQYQLVKQLVDSYKSLNYDSAFAYSKKMNKFAVDSHNQSHIDEAQMEQSSLLISGGLFSPAIDQMAKIKIRKLTTVEKENYYFLYARLYYDLASFISDNYFSLQYRKQGNAYQDSLVSILDKRSDQYQMALAKLSINKTRNYKQAISLLSRVYMKLNPNQHDYAIVTSTLAYLYRRVGDQESQKRMLILAALSDIRNAVKETTAIIQLSQILYKEGDLDRAHNYVHQALDDATIYNARHRKIQISAILPLIETDKLILEKDKKERMRTVVIVISALTIFVIILLIVIYTQLNRIRSSRKVIQHTNLQLGTMNRELKEANKIKDKYIIDFFDVCTEYIDKMNNQQTVFRKKLREKKYDDLLRLLDVSIIDEERQQLFRTFDSIFLSLFPTFIDEFNQQFEKENQFVPKKNELLNTELRIFSLIRLGIDDPVYIAKFLNCTVNTVYTYRTKVKSKAINNNRKDFEKAVMQIGIHQED